MSSKIPHEQLGSLTTDTGCLLAREQHDDINNAPHSRNWCISLSPATKTEVRTICPDLAVPLDYAPKVLRSMVLALAHDGSNHVNDGDTRRVLICLPNLYGLLAQQCRQLHRDVVSRRGRHGAGSPRAVITHRVILHKRPFGFSTNQAALRSTCYLKCAIQKVSLRQKMYLHRRVFVNNLLRKTSKYSHQAHFHEDRGVQVETPV